MNDRRIVRTVWTGLVSGTAVGAVVAALTWVPSVPVKAAGLGGGSLSVATKIGGAADSSTTADLGIPAGLNVSVGPDVSVALEAELKASGGNKGKPENPGHGPDAGGNEKDQRGGGHLDEDDDDDEAVEEPGNGDVEEDQDREQDRQHDRDRDREQDQHEEQSEGADQDQDKGKDNEEHREHAELRKQLRLKLGFEAGPPPGQQDEKQRGQVGIVSLADGDVEVSVKLEMNLAAQLHSSLQFALNHGYEYEWAVEVLQQLNLNVAAGADARLAVEIIKEGVREGTDPDEILARLRVEVGNPPSSPPDTGEPTEPSQPTEPSEPVETTEPTE